MTIRRIAHVISTRSGIGGAEKVLIALANGAVHGGYDYEVINPFDYHPVDSELARELPDNLYVAESISQNDLLRARRWVAKQLAAYRPDAVHVQLAHAMVVTASLKRHIGVPLIASHQHGPVFALGGARLRRHVDRWATRRFDVVVAVSDHVRRYLADQYGLAPHRIHLIPNGWEGAPLPSTPNVRPTVVTVGRLRPEKGQMVLLEAFVMVLKQVPNARLVIVGDGPERTSLSARAEETGIGGSIELVGRQDDVWPFLADAHVFALPSFTETSGIAAMEAMAAGLPVVASGVGGLPEAIREGDNGTLVRPGDKDALARELIRLLVYPNERERMGERGREMAERWRMDKTVVSYLALYERLIA